MEDEYRYRSVRGPRARLKFRRMSRGVSLWSRRLRRRARPGVKSVRRLSSISRRAARACGVAAWRFLRADAERYAEPGSTPAMPRRLGVATARGVFRGARRLLRGVGSGDGDDMVDSLRRSTLNGCDPVYKTDMTIGNWCRYDCVDSCDPPGVVSAGKGSLLPLGLDVMRRRAPSLIRRVWRLSTFALERLGCP